MKFHIKWYLTWWYYFLKHSFQNLGSSGRTLTVLLGAPHLNRQLHYSIIAYGGESGIMLSIYLLWNPVELPCTVASYLGKLFVEYVFGCVSKQSTVPECLFPCSVCWSLEPLLQQQSKCCSALCLGKLQNIALSTRMLTKCPRYMPKKATPKFSYLIRQEKSLMDFHSSLPPTPRPYVWTSITSALSLHVAPPLNSRQTLCIPHKQ